MRRSYGLFPLCFPLRNPFLNFPRSVSSSSPRGPVLCVILSLILCGLCHFSLILSSLILSHFLWSLGCLSYRLIPHLGIVSCSLSFTLHFIFHRSLSVSARLVSFSLLMLCSNYRLRAVPLPVCPVHALTHPLIYLVHACMSVVLYGLLLFPTQMTYCLVVLDCRIQCRYSFWGMRAICPSNTRAVCTHFFPVPPESFVFDDQSFAHF